MIKLLSFIAIIFIVVFSIFVLLICIEYLRYFKRKIVLNLRLKINKQSDEVAKND